MTVEPLRTNAVSRKRTARRRDLERRRGERKWSDPAVQRERHAFRPGEAPSHAWSLGARRSGESRPG